MKPEYKNKKKLCKEWLDKIYKLQKGILALSTTDPTYIYFKSGVSAYDLDQRQLKERGKLQETSGKGFTGVRLGACPESIVDDVSWLEVLIGGQCTGNNSPEIINEATGICQ